MLSVQMEQRVNLKLLVKLGKTFTETYTILKEVYENGCLSRTQITKDRMLFVHLRFVLRSVDGKS
ncbi:hypothetical protein NQ318_007251 [Aromia moschata]|uniref:Uncharacterized protein n=1 Tax=Aromia moschata TaxID=1265417 RepID=A0AAV8XTY2_9CUCU|nr:hypothetical protein NQ318_007251 [Aromia moschata]